MLVSTTYTKRACLGCGGTGEHLRTVRYGITEYRCLHCNHVEKDDGVRKEKGDREFVVLYLEQKNWNSKHRREVVATLEVTEKSNIPRTYTIKVSYPAYGDEHYTRNISAFQTGGGINHLEAQKISAEIDKVVGRKR